MFCSTIIRWSFDIDKLNANWWINWGFSGSTRCLKVLRNPNQTAWVRS
ncbi:hypothetical protein ES332_D10G170500v1 [Gossypium tomentosum]|uniref:Uncharacterized protein n=1 Tax=Gossypium tomentosum TaxID=34277 RepID=A0A5D2J5Z0_GOSTO|nr:hypothetical protein ES332_D10G170500v1 [Gossypium tomentosum]